MCHMRREFYCKTGEWYHGTKARPAFNRESFSQKTKHIETESSDTENQSRGFSCDSQGTLSASENTCTDLDIESCQEEAANPDQNKIMYRGSRRRSMPVFRTELIADSDNDSESDEEVRTRVRRPQRRQSRKHSKKSKYKAKSRDNSDSDEMPSYPHYKNELDRLDIRKEKSTSVGKLTVDFGNNSRHKSSNDSIHRGSVPSYYGSTICDLRDKSPRRGSFSYLKQPEVYYHSSSSSLASEAPKSSNCPSHPVSPDKHRLHPGSPMRDSQPSISYNERRHRKEKRRTSRATIDTNFLVPELRVRDRSCSSGSNSSARSILSAFTDADRPEIHQITFTQDYISSLEPREILLYRDTADKSLRFTGLGMRVMYGKRGYNGKLGAFVSSVEKDGPADSYGIKEGDQILLWNGKSLMGTTFEESKEILSHESDFVQLLVVHHTMSSRNVHVWSMLLIYLVLNDAIEFEDVLIIIFFIAPEDTTPNPPSSLDLKKPKRRMLPKTPIEIKKEERQYSGRLQMSVGYSEDGERLSVTLLRAENLQTTDNCTHKVINPVVFVYLLPGRGVYPPYESIPQFNTSNPQWNEQFNIHDVTREEIKRLALEVTVWSTVSDDHIFLGEILIDLVDMPLNNEIKMYDLQDHDENSSPLPIRKRKESASDATTSSWVSPMTSTMDNSSYTTSPGILSSPSHHRDIRSITEMPAHDKVRMLLINESVGHGQNGKRKQRFNAPHSMPSSPQLSPGSASEENFFLQGGGDHRGSISTMFKKRVGHVATKVSNVTNADRRPSAQEKFKEKIFGRSQSVTEVFNGTAAKTPNSSSPARRRQGTSQAPRPLMTAGSTGSFCSADVDVEDGSHDLPSPERPAPDGDDVMSMLGAAQVPPKAASETQVCGNIRLGFTVSKGQLEIDIINAMIQKKGHDPTPPDTYVKAYLVGGSKVIQKKKTHVVKGSFEPYFRQKIKYSACNIHGRAIKVIVWARQGTFERKQSLGEAVIRLDGLDLMQHTFNWYKLFKPGATDLGSNDSINMW
ncbi:hypothetical protein FSP39_019363 [Pinctada imbricata]|uniref:Regulating synaptic membrane exocytosis protein 2 n=1 Tax=Pinctada imbricata TaxID=66713 RepID=A0AA88XTH8_PINIB|nr:hypothetical protein FSP39_019363 [Pinctada imbricata]